MPIKKTSEKKTPAQKSWEKKTTVKKATEKNKSEIKICPYCWNEIKEKAIKCQYCGEFFDSPNKMRNKVVQGVSEYSMDNDVEYTENSFASFITWSKLNRIWRAKYVARGFVLTLMLYACLLILAWIVSGLSGSNAENIMAIPMIAFLGVSLYWNIILNNKRLHDYWSSWWRQLLLFVPIANIVLLLCMYFGSWNEWENQYWKPSETKTREKVLTVIYVVFLVFMLIAALSAN